MKISTLRMIEKALFRAVSKHLSEEEKRAGFGKEIMDLWFRVHKMIQAQELDAAARKDKGEVLWEIFCPTPCTFSGRNGRYVRRTPNRVIARDFDSFVFGAADRSPAETARKASWGDEDPLKHFRRVMDEGSLVEAEPYRSKEMAQRAERLRKMMPAWAKEEA